MSLQKELALRTDELRDSNDECDELISTNEKMQETIASMQAHMAELEQKCTDLESTRKDIRSKYEEKSNKLQESLTENATLEACNSEAQETIAKLESHMQQLETKFGTTEIDLAEVKANYQDKVDELSNNETQLADLQKQLEQFSELREDLTQQNERLQKIVAERDTVIQTTSQVHARVRDLELELDNQSRAFTSITQQHQQLQEKLKSETARYESAAAELAEQRKTIEGLQVELRELETLREEHRQLQAQLADVKARLKSMTSDRDQQAVNNSRLESNVAALQRHNTSNEETIRDLRRERAAVLERLRQRQQLRREPSPPLKVVSYQEEQTSARMKHDASLGMVYTEAPDEVDDLKEIYGVATVLEKKLNDFGVYTYRQIMNWDDSTIEEFSARLSFRDRIQRDEWVAQARRLHQEKYGTDGSVRRAA